MAIKFTSVKCPECNANLPVEEGREKLYCSYCGTHIIVTNENEHTFRHVDEAKIKQAEANKAIQLKKLEIIEKKRASAEKSKKIKTTATIILCTLAILSFLVAPDSVIGLLMLVIVMWMWIMGDTFSHKEDEIVVDDKIKVPSGISGFEKKNYETIEAMFLQAGFIDVRCVPLHDLSTGWVKKPDTVESITVNGKTVTSGGQKFPPDARVIISYHSFSKSKGV